ncbi:hypothetical protein, partial [Nocardioides pyridinolyticus]
MERIGLALAGLGIASAALTACGGDDGDDFAKGPAEDIVAAAKTDMGELKAVKVAGTVTNDGQEITIDIQASSDGDCTGSIGVDGGTAEVLGVAGETWMRPDEAFWRSSAGENADQVLTAVGDKWVVIAPEDDSFNQFCDLDELLDQLLEDDDQSTYSVDGTDELDGDEVVRVENEDPEEGTSTGYILVDEPHYLVKIEKTEGEDTGSVTFSEFDEEFDVEAPAEDEVVDLEAL